MSFCLQWCAAAEKHLHNIMLHTWSTDFFIHPLTQTFHWQVSHAEERSLYAVCVKQILIDWFSIFIHVNFIMWSVVCYNTYNIQQITSYFHFSLILCWQEVMWFLFCFLKWKENQVGECQSQNIAWLLPVLVKGQIRTVWTWLLGRIAPMELHWTCELKTFLMAGKYLRSGAHLQQAKQN